MKPYPEPHKRSLCGAVTGFFVFLGGRDTLQGAVAVARRRPLLRLPLLLYFYAGYLVCALFDGLRAFSGALFSYVKRHSRAVVAVAAAVLLGVVFACIAPAGVPFGARTVSGDAANASAVPPGSAAPPRAGAHATAGDKAAHTPAPRRRDFTDTGGHWAEEAIARMAIRLDLEADGDAFYPDAPITQAAFLSYLFRGVGADAIAPDWLPLATGDTLPRERAFAMTIDVAETHGLADALVPDRRRRLDRFVDADDLSPPLRHAAAYATSCKIIDGTPTGHLFPAKALTRAEAVTMVANLLDQSGPPDALER